MSIEVSLSDALAQLSATVRPAVIDDEDEHPNEYWQHQFMSSAWTWSSSEQGWVPHLAGGYHSHHQVIRSWVDLGGHEYPSHVALRDDLTDGARVVAAALAPLIFGLHTHGEED